MNLLNSKSLQNILNISLCVYMYLCVIKLVNPSIYYDLSIIIIAIIIGIIGIAKSEKITFLKSYYLVIFVILIIYILLQILQGRTIFSSIYVIINALILFSVLENKFKPIYFYINYILISLIFFNQMLFVGTANSLFFSASQNVVSFSLFINLILLHYIEYTNKKQLSVIPTCILCIISIWAIGRAGIISSIIYFFYVLYYNLFIKKKKKITILYISIIFVILIYILNKNGINIDNYLHKFRDEGIDYSYNPRLDMLIHYVTNINFFTLIVGYNYYDDPYFISWNKNPHNSFIHLHSLFGFLFFPFVFLLLYRLLSFVRSNFFFAIATLLIIFRAWIDNFFFFGVYDFIILAFLLNNYKSSQHECN